MIRAENLEVLVLCWRTGQHSPIHDHDGSNCAVAVVAGVATEVRFERLVDGRLQAATYQSLPAGSVTASADADLHVVANWAKPQQPLVTLHVYSPPLRSMHTFPDALVKPIPADQLVRLAPAGVDTADRPALHPAQEVNCAQ